MHRLRPARVDALLERAATARVLVVGDVMLDHYVSGSVDRISPEAPVPVVRVSEERHSPGGAANVAANVVALGASCCLVGCVGDDPEGAILMEALRASGVETEGLALAGGRRTTVKTRVLGGHQQIVRFDREVEEYVSGPAETGLIGALAELATECDVLVVQDYDKGVLTPGVIRAVLAAAREPQVPSVVDPKRKSFFSYAGSTVFKPNARELEDALGERIEPADGPWMEETRRRLGCEHLLVTLGADGMSLQSAASDLVRLPAVARGVFDVSGAGDTVTATVGVALAAGAEVFEAAILANHAAAQEVAKPGVQTVSREEVRMHLRASIARSH